MINTNADQAAACQCADKVDKYLAQFGARLARGFHIHRETMDVGCRLLLKTEKRDPSKRKPAPAVSAAFCPFCGIKQG